MPRKLALNTRLYSQGLVWPFNGRFYCRAPNMLRTQHHRMPTADSAHRADPTRTPPDTQRSVLSNNSHHCLAIPIYRISVRLGISGHSPHPPTRHPSLPQCNVGATSAPTTRLSSEIPQQVGTDRQRCFGERRGGMTT